MPRYCLTHLVGAEASGPVLLSDHHLHELPSPCHELRHRSGLPVLGQGPQFGLDRLAEASQHPGIDSVCLRQFTRCLREVACLPRVHYDHRKALVAQVAHQGNLQTTRALDDNAQRLHPLQPLRQPLQPLAVILHREAITPRERRDLQSVPRDVNTHILRLGHCSLPLLPPPPNLVDPSLSSSNCSGSKGGNATRRPCSAAGLTRGIYGLPRRSRSSRPPVDMTKYSSVIHRRQLGARLPQRAGANPVQGRLPHPDPPFHRSPRSVACRPVESRLRATFPQALENPSGVSHRLPPRRRRASPLIHHTGGRYAFPRTQLGYKGSPPARTLSLLRGSSG